MISPSIDICWRIAEAEASLAGFPVIEAAHFLDRRLQGGGIDSINSSFT